MNRKPSEMEPPKTIGEQFTEDKGFLAFIKAGGRGSYTAQVKGPLFQKDITGVSRALPELQAGVFALGRSLLGVRILIPQGRTTAGAVQYVVETSFTNAAAVVAEGAAKPKSDKVFTPTTLPVETIAHYFKVAGSRSMICRSLLRRSRLTAFMACRRWKTTRSSTARALRRN